MHVITICTRIKGSGELTEAGGRKGHTVSSILNSRPNITFINISTPFSRYSLQEQLRCLFKTKQNKTKQKEFIRLNENTKVRLKLLARLQASCGWSLFKEKCF